MTTTSDHMTQQDFIEMAADGTGIVISTLTMRREVHILTTIGVPAMQDVADFAELLGALAHPLHAEFVWVAQDHKSMTMAFRLVVMPPVLSAN